MASNRQYVSSAEVATYTSSSAPTDNAISLAEEIIDGYLGPQDKAVSDIIYGRVSAATANTITLEIARHINVFQNNYFLYCYCEILDGTGAGQRQIIKSSTYAGVVTLVGNWTTPPDSTSHYKIYQLGKFPRQQDEYYDGIFSPPVYYKSIPEAVKRATAAQVEYMATQGAAYFASDSTSLNSERIGDYAYTRAQVGSSKDLLIAPKAKTYLRGIMNRKGSFDGEIIS